MSGIKQTGRHRAISFPKWMTLITTEPNYEAYWWHNRHSIFALLFVSLVIISRLTPLQFIKAAYRPLAAPNAQPYQERRDFHTFYTELYFFIMLSLSIFMYYHVSSNLDTHLYEDRYFANEWWFKLSIGYLLIEAVGWIVYYSFYRILIERQFSIYSLSEYLVALPVIILYQLILVCLLFNVKLFHVMETFFQFGSPPASFGQFFTSIVRTLYLGIFIAYIVSFYPKMKVKIIIDFVSIGSGDVFKKYYTPAIYHTTGASIVGIEPENNNTRLFLNEFRTYSLKRAAIYIISTPPSAHIYYISYLSSIGRKFIVEKPLTIDRRELSILEDNFKALLSNCFFFQYYILEKSLSLTYMFYPFTEYEKYLRLSANFDVISHDARDSIMSISRSLGNLSFVSINLLEGFERSRRGSTIHWSESYAGGGMQFDLGVHVFSVLRLVVGTDKNIEIDQISIRTDKERLNILPQHEQSMLAPTFISVVGRAGNTKFITRFGKHITDRNCSREARLQYDNGTVICNFDTETTQVLLKNGKSLSWSTFKPPLESKEGRLRYFGMFDFAIRQLDNQWLYRIDLPELQIRALKDLFDVSDVLDKFKRN